MQYVLFDNYQASQRNKTVFIENEAIMFTKKMPLLRAIAAAVKVHPTHRTVKLSVLP
jgi:hypothetical protein